MQTWTLLAEGSRHTVTADTRTSRTITWSVDGEPVAERKSSEETVRLESEDHGAVEVRHTMLGAPRRATWYAPEETGPASHAGIGGVDLEPEPGSRAAAYEQRLRDHPRRYATIETLGGVGKVVVPLVVAALLARFAFSFDLPFSLPDWDLPDLPSIPFPDLPSVPLPDLPEISLPDWVARVVDAAKYVVPVVIALLLALAELRRRRTQDELREQRRREVGPTEPDDEERDPGPGRSD